MRTVFFVFLFLSFSLFIPHIGHSQEKSYFYKEIKSVFEIKNDSTVRVKETQTYSFDSGEFHKGWRSIPINGTGGITGISVRDVSMGENLEFSRLRLDKTDSASWGKYTTYSENGNQIIEWYYDMGNGLNPTERIWIIYYTIHGGIEFGEQQNRFYWNAFTEFNVPVKSASIQVTLPGEYQIDDTNGFFYRSSVNEATKLLPISENSYLSIEKDFYPGEAYTIDISWKKGTPTLWAYMIDFIKMNFGTILSLLIFLSGILYCFVHWYRGKQKEKRSVIPEYEPPKDIPPIFAEIILKELVTPKGFSATIVDLAVRGYLKIIEKENRILFWKTKSYTLKLLKEINEDANLQDFEKAYLKILFEKSHKFSLDDLKKNHMYQREFSFKIKNVESELIRELDSDTQAFSKGGIQKEKYLYLSVLGSILFFSLFWILGSKLFLSYAISQVWLTFVTLLSVGFIVWAFVRFEAELSEKGVEVKQRLLGFKMFLSVTEKDRVKTLTPDLFEKYLPYAMIFGVEKKWAQTFEGMHLPPPEWVAASSVTHVATDGIVSVFSPSAFSTSFSSAFTSAIMSSGASGASGGGSAGGGGGGGGGGAS